MAKNVLLECYFGFYRTDSNFCVMSVKLQSFPTKKRIVLLDTLHSFFILLLYNAEASIIVSSSVDKLFRAEVKLL